jgi:GAF domain-containing protein
MCVPIIAPSVGLVGVIVLQQLFAADQPTAASQFTEDYQAALYSLGEFVAASLRNGALLEQTTSAFAASRDANNRIEIMLGIAKALMSEHRLSVLVSRIISEVPELLECDRCTLFFCNRNTNELIVTKGSSYGRRTSSMLNPALLESNRKSSGGSSGNLNLTPSSPSPLTPSAAAAGASTPSTPSASSEEVESAAGGALPFGEATEVRMPMDRGVAGFVATTGSTLNIPDAYADERFNPAMDQKTGFRTRNILCVPMQDANGDIIGVIQTLNKKERAFDASDEMILRMFAAHAAVAVKNSRLFAEAQRALRKSDALLEVTNAITREMDLPPLINVIVNKTQLLLTAERCTVWLVDDEKEERELWSTASMSCGVGAPLPINTNVEVIMRIPSNRGIAGHVASTGQLVNLEDAYTDSRFNQQMDKTSGFRTRALLCIPIFSQGNSPSTPRSSSSEAPSGAKVLGVIQALNKKLGGMFTDEDVRMMQAFAAQAAVAIAKHKLHHETRKALNQALREQRNLKFLLTFSRNLCAELQTANVAQQLQRQVCDLLSADGVHIFMVDTEEEVSGTMMVRVTDDDAPVPSDPWQSLFPASGQRMRFPAPKGLMCNVLQSGVGALVRLLHLFACYCVLRF